MLYKYHLHVIVYANKDDNNNIFILLKFRLDIKSFSSKVLLSIQNVPL